MSNEDPCNSPKRDLGILLFPPSIPPPCDCYVDVLLPVASIFSLFKGIGKRFFARTLLSFELSLLKTPLKRANDIKRYANNVLLSLKNKVQFLEDELVTITEKIKQQLENLDWVEFLISNVWDKIEPLRKQAVSLHNRMKTLAAKYNVSYSLQDGVPVVNLNDIPANIRPEFSSALSGYNNARNELFALTNELSTLEQNKTFANDAIKYLGNERDAISKALNSMNCPAITIGDTSIPSQPIKGQINAVQDLIPVLKREEDRIADIISRGNTAQVSNNKDTMLNSINEIDNGWSDIAAQAGQLLFDLLNALSIVEKVSCMESGMLDESTCECSKCPQGKQLCIPLQTGLEDLLPQPPGVRMGTELNRCVDACCPGMELARRFSSLSEVINSFIPPCYCKCSDPDKTEKPCNKADCVAKVICADPEPDSGELGFFGTSKYQWNADKCDWECKQGRCTTTTTTTTSTTPPPTTTTSTTTTTTSTTPPPTTTTSTTTTTTSTTQPPTTQPPCQQGCANTVDAGWFVDGCKCDSFSTFYPCNDTHCKVIDSEGNEKKGYCIANDDSLKNNSNYEWKESSCKFECKNGETQAKCEAKNPPGRWFPLSCECADPPTTCPPCPETQYRPGLNCNNPCKCFDCSPEGKLEDPTGLNPACTCVCNPETACPDNKKLKANASYPICECECKESCQSPLVQKSSDCSCDCPTGPFTVHKCTTGDGVVKCVECYEASGTYNPNTCSCDCNEPCPSPKVRKAPDIEGGLTKNPTCLCYCPENDIQCKCEDIFGGQKCSKNKEYLYDITLPYKCKCVCKTVLDCGTLKHFDTDTCACVCNNINDVCLFGQVLDPETCLCVTTTTTTPPPTTSTAPPTTTTNGPTTTPTPCSGDEYCEPFCCVDGVCQECPPVEYQWYCTDC